MSDEPEFTTVTSYLHYQDADAAAEWLTRVVGFGPVNPARIKRDGAGHWQEGELAIGSTRIDISGGRAPDSDSGAGALLIVGVTNVDAQYRRMLAAGGELGPPRDEAYGPRTCHITDPWGYQWYFWQGEATYPPQ